MYSEGKIVSIKKIKKPKMVYNIGVKDNNNYFANDLLVHNCLEEPHSKFYEQVASIRHLFSVCWFMTATPLKNNIEGLYWLMYMLDPNILKDWYTFKNSFLDSSSNSDNSLSILAHISTTLDFSLEAYSLTLLT